MTIAENVAIGKEVAALLELVETQPPRYWEELIRQAAAKLPAKEPVLDRPMNDAQAARFEQVEIAFGKHQGERIADVPAEYLLWLTESDFAAALKRYLASARFQNRLDC